MLSEDLAHREYFLKLFPDVEFAPSAQFFPYRLQNLVELGIVNVLTIDLHVRFSFQIKKNTGSLQGACVRLFNKDHETTREGNIYVLHHNGQKFPVFAREVLFTLDPAGTWRALFLQTLAGFPLLSFLLFNLLLFVLPADVSGFFSRINILALLIVGCYLAYKLLMFFLRMISSSRGEVGGVHFSVRDQADQLVITPELTTRLVALTGIGVTHIAFQGDSILFRQDPEYAKKPWWRAFIDLIWKSKIHQKTDFVSLQQGISVFNTL